MRTATSIKGVMCVLIVISLGIAGCASDNAALQQTQEPKKPDVIFVPTPPEVVAAAKIGCRAFGFDVDPNRIKEPKENVEKNGVGNLATIE